MKYKVGDKVRVKSGLIAGNYYNEVNVSHKMVAMAGSQLTVEDIRGECYFVCENLFVWTDEMFESDILIPSKSALMEFLCDEAPDEVNYD